MHSVSLYESEAISIRPALERKENVAALVRTLQHVYVNPDHARHYIAFFNRSYLQLLDSGKWDYCTNGHKLFCASMETRFFGTPHDNVNVVEKGICTREEWESELDFSEC